MEEKKYDEVVIQLKKEGVPVGTISMELSQILLLMENHGQPMGDVLELMVDAMNSEVKDTDGN